MDAPCAGGTALSAWRALPVAAALLLAACEDAAPRILGRPGLADGEFDTPRGIAAAGGRVAVLDRTGRCQVFSPDGPFERSFRVVPEGARRGFPLGLLLDPSGAIRIVHTHDAALVLHGPDGREISRFGSSGLGEGEFTMPQRALLHGGEIFVSDFGYEDRHRILVFTPEGRFLRRIGGPGSGAALQRPMGLAVDETGVLWVADGSGKLFRFDARAGRLLGTVGREGSGPGELTWPTGLAAWPEGGVVVAEAGNHRLQRFAADGRSLGTFGRNGSGPGEFRTPYDCAVDGPRLWVADTDNHRVQGFRRDAIPWSAVPQESR
jgi:tripartite motif-containing protein 71